MRSLISFPILVLAAAFASAVRAQPGPEVQPEPVDQPSVEPAPVVSPPPVPQPPAPVGEVPQPAEDVPPVGKMDGAAPAAEPVPPATDPALSAQDSARDAATRAAMRAADSAAAMGRMRSEQARQRGRSGIGQPPPPSQVFVPEPLPAATADAPSDTGTWVDERGEGRRLKNDPRAHKLYRSPRKAFFYSLVVPGSGQAWCGAYVRAGLFVAAEVGLLYGWYDVSIRQAREKTKEAKRFADENWSASRYEATRKRYYDSAVLKNREQGFTRTTPYRDRYCEAIYAFDETALREACNEPPDDSAKNYQGHLAILEDRDLSVDQVSALRDARIKDPAAFYDRIGRDEEFVPGWKDATTHTVTLQDLLDYETALTDNDPSTVPTASPWGVSQMRAEYLALRQEADDLAATQGWFLGGLVLNHMLSAIDAALTAQRHNRRLYDEERTSWVDGLHVQGGLAWTNGPATRADFHLEF